MHFDILCPSIQNTLSSKTCKSCEKSVKTSNVENMITNRATLHAMYTDSLIEL